MLLWLDYRSREKGGLEGGPAGTTDNCFGRTARETYWTVGSWKEILFQ